LSFENPQGSKGLPLAQQKHVCFALLDCNLNDYKIIVSQLTSLILFVLANSKSSNV
jgi:hypothetical protein